MKRLQPVLFSCLMMLTLTGLKGQDIHFTMFNMSPLTLNPALAGAYYGTARVGGVYRDQWASFLSNQFTTPAFYIDAPIVRGFREQDWVGIGIVTINDQAGTGNLRNQGSLLTAAYHLGLDRKRKNVLTLGVQVGAMSRRIDKENLLFADSYNALGEPVEVSQDDSRIVDDQSALDINGGLLFRSKIDEATNFEAGLAVAHISNPEYSLFSGGGVGPGNRDEGNRPLRLTIHSRLKKQLDEKWSITPSLIAQTTTGTFEIAAQGWAGYTIKEDIELLGGLAYRLGDAAALMVGTQYKDLRVGISYDFNLSSLSTASNNLGGFELAASYIIKLYKDPNVSRAIVCPEF